MPVETLWVAEPAGQYAQPPHKGQSSQDSNSDSISGLPISAILQESASSIKMRIN